MAAVKWYSEFGEEKGTILEGGVISGVEIVDRDYAGPKIKVLSGGTPCIIELPSFSDPFMEIRSTKATIQWIAQESVNFSIADLSITDDRKYKVRYYRYNADQTQKEYLWYGYMVFGDAEEPCVPKPYAVSFAATCGLPFLREAYFVTQFGTFVEGNISLIKIIANCLAATGHELDIHTFVNLYEEGIPYGIASALASANIDADGLRGMKCDEVLEGVLSALGAFVVQSRGAWVIKSVKDQTTFLTPRRRFNSDGVDIGYDLYNQTASYGRTEFNSVTPNLRPIKGRTVKLAKPNSIVTETVSPGIAVNRLLNGGFSGGILGGKVPGWDTQLGTLHHPVASGITRSGTNRPDDPYKIDITGENAIISFGDRTYLSLHDDIVINGGPWNADPRAKTRIRISGAYRAMDIDYFLIMVRVARENKNISYLMDGGKWNDSKKLDGSTEGAIKMLVDVRKEAGGGHDFSTVPLKTFEITSDLITNFIQAGNQAVAKVHFVVYAGVTKSSDYFATSNPRLTWEDFSLTVVNDTIFEGEHKYQVDAKFPIRNPNPANFTAIIADKIGIETPENGRPDRRVMTGYMSRPGGALTTGWRRYPGGALDPTDNNFEPIQKKALRERVRLLCGNRRISEGKFKGYGVWPDHAVFSRLENPGAGLPTKFYTVNGWSWNVKTMKYSLKLFELNFSPLANEVIELANESGGSRGNRQYLGAGGGSQAGAGTGSGIAIQEIVIDDIDPFEYEVTIADVEKRVLDIGAIILSAHIPANLAARILYQPEWIPVVTIDRGEMLQVIPEDGVLKILWEGKPTKSGVYQILVELTGLYGEDYTVSIPIVVEPSPDFIESWPPRFIDLPPLYFIAGKLATKELFLTDYLDPDGEHDGTGLGARLISPPYWVTDTRMVFMNLSVTGTPDRPGVFFVTYELSDAIGRTTTVAFETIVLDPSFMTYELLDTSGPAPVVVGNLPGVYTLPLRWDVNFRIKGMHSRYKSILKGGGLNANVVNRSLEEEISPTADGSYRFFLEDNGMVTGAGQFNLSADSYLQGNHIFGETIDFVLTDAAFLNLIRFFLIKDGITLGEIVQDGSSSFIDPETGNYRIDIEGVEHDKAIVIFDLVPPLEVEHVGSETDFSYTFSQTDVLISIDQHTVTVTLYLAGEKVATRYVKFETVADKPKPIAGLKLITMIPNTTDYTVISELPQTGGSFDLPENWNVLSDVETEEYDYEKVEIWELRGGGLIEINTSTYTRQPNFNTFIAPVTKSEFFLFRELNSTRIGNIHAQPSTLRVMYTRLNGGATGRAVAILKANFSFGPSVPIDDAPIKQPGENVVDYFAGDGLLEEVENFGKTFSVNVDQETIIINPEGKVSLNPDFVGGSDGEEGVIVKIGPSKTLVGSLISEQGDLITAKGSIYLDSPGENKILLYTENGISATIYRDQAGNELFWFQSESSAMRINVPGVINDAIRIERATGNVSFARPITVNTGALAPIITNSEAKVTNLHADIFDGYHGDHYLSRANHTGTQLAVTISDFTEAARLSLSAGEGIDYDSAAGMISVDSTWTDDKYAAKEHTHTIADITDYDGITGSGTAGKFALFAAGKVVADSLVSQNAGVVKISSAVTVLGADSAQKIAIFGESSYSAIAFQNVDANFNNWVLYGTNSHLRIDIPGVINEVFTISRADGQAAFKNFVSGIDPTDAQHLVTKNYVDIELSGKSDTGHTHIASDISNFTPAVRGSLSGSGPISVDPSTGVISYSGGSGSGTVGGSGTAGVYPVWDVGGESLKDGGIKEIGTEIQVVSGRGFAVLGPAAVRNTLHVWVDLRVGHTDTHGTILVHNNSSGVKAETAAIEINSTTKVFLPSRMNLAQLNTILAPEGAIAYAAITLGSTAGYLYLRKRLNDGSVVWTNLETIVS
jgi:hypothetical protein